MVFLVGTDENGKFQLWTGTDYLPRIFLASFASLKLGSIFRAFSIYSLGYFILPPENTCQQRIGT